jgi:hypothetical protein
VERSHLMSDLSQPHCMAAFTGTNNLVDFKEADGYKSC